MKEKYTDEKVRDLQIKTLEEKLKQALEKIPGDLSNNYRNTDINELRKMPEWGVAERIDYLLWELQSQKK